MGQFLKTEHTLEEPSHTSDSKHSSPPLPKRCHETLSPSRVTKPSRFFFDQDLITSVNLLSPYVENTASIVKNVDDAFIVSEVANNADPVFNYVLLGDTVSDGLFFWIIVGVNTTASYSYSAASELTAGGGVELSSSTGPGGGLPPNGTWPGNGTAPSGVAGVSGFPTVTGG